MHIYLIKSFQEKMFLKNKIQNRLYLKIIITEKRILFGFITLSYK
jgi:hypothetical protein